MVRSKIYLGGQVQQVGLRLAVKEKAIELGVTGEVKNLTDGRVCLVVEAELEKIENLLQFIKKNFQIKSLERADRPDREKLYQNFTITHQTCR